MQQENAIEIWENQDEKFDIIFLRKNSEKKCNFPRRDTITGTAAAVSAQQQEFQSSCDSKGQQ